MKTTPVRQIVLVAVFAVVAIRAGAQQDKSASQLHKMVGDFRLTVAAMMKNQATAEQRTAKTTATAERLVAIAHYDGGVFSDSSSIHYSGGRGSDHSGNDLRGCLNLLYRPEAEHFPYAESPLAQSAELRIKCDSLVSFDAAGQRSDLFQFSYNAAQQPTTYSHVRYEGSGGAERSIMSYNPSGQRLLLEYGEGASLSSLSPVSTEYSRYGIEGTIASDSTVETAASTEYLRRAYVYVAGRLNEISLYYGLGSLTLYFARYEFGYDAAGRLTQAALFFDNGGPAFDLLAKDSLAYAGPHSFPIYQKTTADTGSGDFATTITQYHVNAVGLRDTAYFFDGAALPLGTTVYQYNSAGLPVRAMSFEPASGGVPVSTANYYYETYEQVGLSQERDATGRRSFQLHPNPVTDDVRLRWNGCMIGRAEIRDLAGRRAGTVETFGQATAGTLSLDLHSYLPGIYVVSLYSEKGAFLAALRLIKQ